MTDKDKLIDDEKELVEIFNDHYIDILEKTSGKPAENSFKNFDDYFKIVLKIIKKCKNHQSTLEIRKILKLTETFKIPKD